MAISCTITAHYTYSSQAGVWVSGSPGIIGYDSRGYRHAICCKINISGLTSGTCSELRAYYTSKATSNFTGKVAIAISTIAPDSHAPENPFGTGLSLNTSFTTVSAAHNVSLDNGLSSISNGTYYIYITPNWSTTGRALIDAEIYNVSVSGTSPTTEWYWRVLYDANGSSTAPATFPSGSSTIYDPINAGYYSEDSSAPFNYTPLTSSSYIPTRTGYTFKGWSDSPSGSIISTIPITPSSSASGTQGNLYAVWEKNKPTHIIHLIKGAAVSQFNFRYTVGGSLQPTETLTGNSISFSADELSTISISSPVLATGHTFPINILEATDSEYLKYGWVNSLSSQSDTKTLTVPSSDIYIEVGGAGHYEIRYYDGDTPLDITPTSGISYNSGSLSLTLTSVRPSKFGFVFDDRWLIDGVSYPRSGTFTFPNPKLVSAKAVWITGFRYHLSFNSVGGSYTPPDQYYPSSGVTTDTSHSFSIPDRYPSKWGYTFTGWKFNGSTTVYQPGESVTLFSSATERTLVAQWITYSQEFRLTFNPNGGSGKPPDVVYTTTNPSVRQVGLVIPADSTIPSLPGYVFMGWATSTTSGVIYQRGQSVPVGIEHPTQLLVAVWAQKYFGRIRYHLQGGTITGGIPGLDYYDGTVYSRGGIGTVNGNIYLYSPVKNGFQFQYWADAPMEVMASQKYHPGRSVPIPCNTTNQNHPTMDLYAIYVSGDEKLYGRIQYNGGTDSQGRQGVFHTALGDLTDIYSIIYDAPLPPSLLSPVAILKEPINPTYNPEKVGGIFIGWSTVDRATKPQYRNGDQIDLYLRSRNQSDPTITKLYAVWSNENHRLILDANGGSFPGGNSRYTITEPYGTIINLENEPKPVRSNYKLLGWNPNSTAGAPLYPIDYVYTMSYIDVTWYAIWGNEDIPEFNWTSDDDANIIPGELVTNITATKWNSLRSIIGQISDSAPPGAEISPGEVLTALQFNLIRNGIWNLPGGGFDLPFAAKDSDVLASMFHSETSSDATLKNAINSAIQYYNNHN